MMGEQCDDGNTINGDGCSNNCTQESNYECYPTNISMPTICRYVRKDISIKLIHIEKTTNKNQGKFTFQLKPTLLNFRKLNLSSAVSFNLNQSHTINSIYFDNNSLVVLVDYN